MRSLGEKSAKGGYSVANGLERKGFSVRQASVFPQSPTADFEMQWAISYLSGADFRLNCGRDERRSMPKVKLWGRKLHLPKSRPLRVAMGLGFIALGLVGFLPVVGFWMIPVGLVILSADSPLARRFRRRAEIWVLRRYNRWRKRGA